MNQNNASRRSELGLLVVLVAIAEAGSVSAAANRLSLSQSAVSHALKRLRDITGDKLFEQIGRRMAPTVVATQMLEDARRIIEGADALLRQQVFDPAVTMPDLMLGVTDYALSAFGIPILNQLMTINSSARISFVPVGPQTIDELLALKIDFAFWGDIGDPRIVPPILATELFRDNYIGVMCRSHPIAEAARRDCIGLEDWLAWPHVRFTSDTPGASSIDKALAMRGLQRNIAVTSPSHKMNLELIRSSPLLLSLPSRLAGLVNTKELVPFTLPLSIPPYPYYLLCHERMARNPAITFLRERILEACAAPGVVAKV
jgi:DNA-binding transcriptional LysR family regulator